MSRATVSIAAPTAADTPTVATPVPPRKTTTVTTTTTTPVVQAGNGAACPPGYVTITTKEGCEGAAQRMGLSPPKTFPNRNGRYAPGCFYYPGKGKASYVITEGDPAADQPVSSEYLCALKGATLNTTTEAAWTLPPGTWPPRRIASTTTTSAPTTTTTATVGTTQLPVVVDSTGSMCKEGYTKAIGRQECARAASAMRLVSSPREFPNPNNQYARGCFYYPGYGKATYL